MDLRTVKHFIWKSGGDLTLHYRQKSTWKSQFLKRDLSSFANHHPPLTCSTLKPHCVVQSRSINENPVKFVRTWLTVYHRELTRTGRSSQETPGKKEWSVFLFFLSFLFFTVWQESREWTVFSSAHQFLSFFFLLFFDCYVYSFLLIGIFFLKRLKLQYMFVSKSVCVHMDVVDCLFVLVHSRNCPCSTNTPHPSQLYHQFGSTLGLWVASQSSSVLSSS